MGLRTRWTNQSVLSLAGTEDPVEAVSRLAREVVADAIDRGWTGPPFDPLALARLRGLAVVPSADVRDARIVPTGESGLRIEFNPNRSRRRVRYSIAHEIAHSLFPDCAEVVRSRKANDVRGEGDEWQLEALCNIAAAEVLMPLGVASGAKALEPALDEFLSVRDRFDLSTEATFIRLAQVANAPFAMFCASRASGASAVPHFRIDYAVGSRSWPYPTAGCAFRSEQSVASHCTSVGFTWKGEETWLFPSRRFRVEAVGIPSYPGSQYPRVVGLAVPTARGARVPQRVSYVVGDATRPRGSGRKILVHVVNDRTPNWGGRGFAPALARTFPGAQEAFRSWATEHRLSRQLGKVHLTTVGPDIQIASMVAQHGYGPAPKPRIRYAALATGLVEVANAARQTGASLHMPRIGCGEAGGSWPVIEELIQSAVARSDVSVTVYDLPGKSVPEPAQRAFALGVT